MENNSVSPKVAYWQIFRMIFVILFLYLLGDVFFRWDGFKYYATFADYIPSVALISVLWSIVAAFTALIIWLSLVVVEWFCRRIGWLIRVEHELIFIGIFVANIFYGLPKKCESWA